MSIFVLCFRVRKCGLVTRWTVAPHCFPVRFPLRRHSHPVRRRHRAIPVAAALSFSRNPHPGHSLVLAQSPSRPSNVVAVAVAILVTAALLFLCNSSRSRPLVLTRSSSRPPHVLAGRTTPSLLTRPPSRLSHVVAAVASAPAYDSSPAHSRALPIAAAFLSSRSPSQGRPFVLTPRAISLSVLVAVT